MRSVFFCCALLFLPYLLAAADTVPPSAKWLQPKPKRVIQSNIIRLLVEAQDSGSGIKEVRYYVSYQLRTGVRVVDTLISVIKEPPYEYLWDCHDLPDQDMWRLHIKAEIMDSAGNKTVLGPPESFDRWYIILDRHPESSMARHVCHYYPENLSVDGSLDDWPDLSSENFKNNDNLIHFRSCWNQDFLYLCVIVTDQYLSVSPDKAVTKKWPTQEFEYLNLFGFDYVEFIFDPEDMRGHFKTPRNYELQICADGAFQGNIVDLENREQRGWGDNVKVAVNHRGSINNHDDVDSFFIIEAAVPWPELGITPQKDLEMGFDIFNGDMELKTPNYKGAFTSWGGAFTSNNDNPTEWGTLVLKKERSITWAFWTSGIFVLFLIFVVKLIRDKRRLMNEIREISNPKIKAALDYLNSNYTDPEITIKKIAEFAGLHEVYFGSLFRDQTGKSYNEYLNELRIRKAAEIFRKDPQKKVTDVAFEVGFGTLDHFTRVFKKVFNMTPRDYIKKQE
jgi:AraC-like DNA-binding protein